MKNLKNQLNFITVMKKLMMSTNITQVHSKQMEEYLNLFAKSSSILLNLILLFTCLTLSHY